MMQSNKQYKNDGKMMDHGNFTHPNLPQSPALQCRRLCRLPDRTSQPAHAHSSVAPAVRQIVRQMAPSSPRRFPFGLFAPFLATRFLSNIPTFHPGHPTPPPTCLMNTHIFCFLPLNFLFFVLCSFDMGAQK